MNVFELTCERMKQIGYTPAVEEYPTVEYCIAAAENYIKAQINDKIIPVELCFVWSDMAAGYFLRDKKATGALGNDFDFSAPAKSITEGDISVTFAGAADGVLSNEARFDAIIDKLINPDKSVFFAFRRFKW